MGEKAEVERARLSEENQRMIKENTVLQKQIEEDAFQKELLENRLAEAELCIGATRKDQEQVMAAVRLYERQAEQISRQAAEGRTLGPGLSSAFRDNPEEVVSHVRLQKRRDR